MPILMALGLAVGTTAAAQERPVALPSCAGDQPALGDLGYSGLSCNCTHFYDDSDPARSVWRFRGEPRIEGVKRGGPADGKLRRGDLVVAIDGVLITSEEGGRRFAQVQPGDLVQLTVRREGREVEVEITPDPVCPSEISTPTPRAAPAAPRPAAVRLPTPRPDPVLPTQAPAARVPSPPPPLPSSLASGGWLGFSLRCSQCGWSERDGKVVWEFSEPPIIEQVEPDGPAARAGLLDGDRLIEIDHLDITTAEAGTRFGAIKPGERVALRVLGDGAEALHVVTAEKRWTVRLGQQPVLEHRPNRLVTERFTGTIGNAVIQVTGGAVSVTQTDDEIIIRSADITVRIRRTDTER